MMGIGIIIPIIPDLILDLTGKSVSDAAVIGGLLISTYAIFQFFFSPVLGEISDRYGRKPLLLLGLFGLGLDYLICAFAPTIGWLFVGRSLAGFFGASHTVAMAYVADISTKENKAKNYGIIGAAFGLGFVLGPAIGGVIGEEWGTKAPFLVAACFSFLNFIFGLFFVSESLPLERRRKINYAKMIPFVSLSYLRKYKAVIGFILAFALVQFAGQTMPITWSYFTKTSLGWSPGDIGLSLMFVGLLVSAVQAGLTGFLVNKLGDKRVIIFGFILYTLGMFAISFSTTSIYLYLACIPYILGGIAGPTIQGLVSNNVSELEQGNLQGVLASLGSLTAIIAPLVFTPLFSFYANKTNEIYFPGAPFLLGAIILILATIVAAFSLKSLKQPSKDS